MAQKQAEDPLESPAIVRLSADDLFWEEVRRARERPGVEKMLDGVRLFDLSCRVMKDGIRAQFPDASDERVQQILIERVELARRLDRLP